MSTIREGAPISSVHHRPLLTGGNVPVLIKPHETASAGARNPLSLEPRSIIPKELQTTFALLKRMGNEKGTARGMLQTKKTKKQIRQMRSLPLSNKLLKNMPSPRHTRVNPRRSKRRELWRISSLQLHRIWSQQVVVEPLCVQATSPDASSAPKR